MSRIDEIRARHARSVRGNHDHADFAWLLDEVERLTAERDEARATKDMHKERTEEAEREAERHRRNYVMAVNERDVIIDRYSDWEERIVERATELADERDDLAATIMLIEALLAQRKTEENNDDI